MDLETIRKMLRSDDMGTLKGFEKLLQDKKVHQSSGTAKGYAEGGMVNEMDENKFPELGAILKTVQSTPPTDYSFYKNMTAEDRAALAQKLMEQQHGGMNAVASGLAGVGDAISNSYGDKNTSFQKDAEAKAAATGAQQLSDFDTLRSQKMQDFQGNQMAQEGDPMSSLSQQGRDFFKANGVQVPSGMNFQQLKTLAPSMADLVKGKWEQSFRDAQLAQGAAQNQASNDLRSQEIRRQEASDASDVAMKEEAKKMEAAEGLQKRPWYQKGVELIPPFKSDATKLMENTLNGGSVGFDEDKEARYQAWKAKQGR